MNETQVQMQRRMDDFFLTHSYNAEDDWRKTPATAEDPVDDAAVPVVSLKGNPNHLPGGSPEGGEFTTGPGGGAATNAKPSKPRKVTIIGQGVQHSPETYASLQRRVSEELDRIGMQDQAVEFTFGDMKPITGLEAIGVKAVECAHFAPRTGATSDGRTIRYKDGVISINLDSMPMFTPFGLESVVRHEALHARFLYVERSSERIRTFIDKDLNRTFLEAEGRKVSSYAANWWDRSNSVINDYTGKPSAWYTLNAANESLAEIHARIHMSRSEYPSYAKLNDIVESVWARRKH